MQCNAWQIQGKCLCLDYDGITDPDRPVVNVEFTHERQTFRTRAELKAFLRSVEAEVSGLISDVSYASSTGLINDYLVAMLPEGEAAHGGQAPVLP